MLGKRILRIVLTGVGLTSLAALVYLAGPMIAIGSYHPLESYIVRETIILLLVTGVAAFGSFSFYKHRKNSQKIAEGIAGEGEPVDDEPVLKERMKDALATLKTAAEASPATFMICHGTSSSARLVQARPRRWSIPA
jgi:type VI secretion system protein ImpL